jgi:hypothetical protein
MNLCECDSEEREYGVVSSEEREYGVVDGVNTTK